MRWRLLLVCYRLLLVFCSSQLYDQPFRKNLMTHSGIQLVSSGCAQCKSNTFLGFLAADLRHYTWHIMSLGNQLFWATAEMRTGPWMDWENMYNSLDQLRKIPFKTLSRIDKLFVLRAHPSVSKMNVLQLLSKINLWHNNKKCKMALKSTPLSLLWLMFCKMINASDPTFH